MITRRRADARASEESMGFFGPVEDRLALRELLDAYSDASIRHDIDAIASLWHDEGVWEFEMGEFHGKDQIRHTLFGLRDRYGGVHRADIRMYNSFPAELRIDGSDASGRSFVSMFAAVSGSAIAAEIFGAYEDEYRKENSLWLFKSRKFKTLVKRQASNPSERSSYDP
jgi:hypothetical protein